MIAEDKKMLPLKFNNNLQIAGEAICTIDLLGFREGDSVIITPECMHAFHPKCLDEWLNANYQEKRCPNCNKELGGYRINMNTEVKDIEVKL